MMEDQNRKSTICGINQDALSSAIAAVGYDIIDNIICPLMGISNVIADLYHASPGDYLTGNNPEEDSRLFQRCKKQMLSRYGLKQEDLDHFNASVPIILFVVFILEHGDPIAAEKLPKKCWLDNSGLL